MSPTKTPIELLDGYESLRQQRYAGVLALAWHLGRRPHGLEVAWLLGVSRSYASSLMNDPDGSIDRERKARYAGTCEKCGGPTDGSNGRPKAPKVCMRCLVVNGSPARRAGPTRSYAIWTEQKCLDSIVRWVDRNGRIPRTVDLTRAEPGERPCFGTIVRHCYRHERGVETVKLSDGRTWERRFSQITRDLRDILVELAPRLPVAAVVTARNAWVRARLFEVLGIENIVHEAGSKVDVDEHGILWRIERDEWPEPIVMVEVVNSTPEPDGTFKNYFLRVPPDTETPRAGIAWTFDVEADEYALAVAT